MKNLLLILILTAFCISTFAQTEKYSKVKFKLNGTDKTVQKLAETGIAIDHGDYKKNQYFISDFSQKDIATAIRNGFEAEIIIDDVSAHYAARITDSTVINNRLNSNCNPFSILNNITIPSNFSLGTMGGFLTYNQLMAQLDSMSAKYPQLIKSKSPVNNITTHQSRPVFWLKISDQPNTDENEPEVLYTALHHAREPASMQQLVFYMWYLLENYATNNMIKQLVDNTELYFIPCINPDGYIYNQTTNPNGGGMWRKNRRVMGSNTFGVDLNRNYAMGFGYDNNGSSPDSTQDNYRGPFAFSEPETQIIRDFCNNHEFKITINYHTYGNWLIYPWQYLNPVQVPDSLIYTRYSKFLSQENNYVTGTAVQTVNYTANGGSDDWMFGEQTTKGKIYSFTPEAGDASDGFWPAQNRIIDICKVNVSQNIHAAQLAGKYAEVKDNSPGLISQYNGYFRYAIQRLGLDSSGTYTVSIIPLDNLITSIGNPKTYNNLNLLQTALDSISYSLNSGISSGQVIQYVLRVNNGLYDVNDTIRKLFGTPTTAYTNSGNALTGWTSTGGNWGISTSQFVSAPSSITDSPNGQYANNINKTLTQNTNIDLSNCVSAKLNFWTKWDIETGYDYAEVFASNDNGATWTPLCGNYTKTGNANQDFGQPIYDGLQNTWVYEEMDLGMFVGQQIKIRFKLFSDQYVTGDGFYVDDLKVTKISASPNRTLNIGENFGTKVYPVPTNKELIIEKTNNQTIGDLYIYNTLGEAVIQERCNAYKFSLDVSELPDGIYFIKCDHYFDKIIISK